MPESRFIKTVTYGGYDKADVIRRLEFLNEQLFSLKNELRETKLLLESSKNGKEIQKSIETVLAGERAKLTEVQVQNETLSTKIKAVEDSNRKYEEEIKKLTASLEEANSKLSDANTQLAASNTDDEALALSAVFIEAKKSADMLENSAKEKADQLQNSAAEAAEESIAYANDESAMIIYEAECKAADIIANAKNSAGNLGASYENIRSSVLSKINALGEQLTNVKDAIAKLEENSVSNLSECDEMLKKAEDTLNESEVPSIDEPAKYTPEYPERPKRTAEHELIEARKRKEELDKLKQMAESLGDNNDKEAPVDSSAPAKEETAPADASDNKDNNNNNSKKGGKIDLAMLAKQAQALKDK